MAGMRIKRRSVPGAMISLVPLVDVMLILLVFFMVTSTYLNLDIVPAVDPADTPPDLGQTNSGTDKSAPLLVRIAADGQPAIRGQTMSLRELEAHIRTRLQDAPLTSVVVLPSASANMQALISVMDAATGAGATRLQVIRLEAR